MPIAAASGFTLAAYGQLLAVHGTTGAAVPATAALTSLGYSGEHFDVKAQQQYLRARWYNPANGQFNRLDPFAGNMQDPQSLHKYAYVHGNPINATDPTGLMASATVSAGSLGSSLMSIAVPALAATARILLVGGTGVGVAYFGMQAIARVAVLIYEWSGWGAVAGTSAGAAVVASYADELLQQTDGWINGTGSERFKRILEAIKNEAESVAKELTETLKRVGRQASKAPIFFDVEAAWPEPYQVDVSHLLTHPLDIFLQRVVRDDADARAIRDAITNRIETVEGKVRGPGEQMHEYPFNSTTKASVAYSSADFVDGGQNALQGSMLWSFYSVILKQRRDFVNLPVPRSIVDVP